MRLLIHDYSGHPFQVQLSRSLARQGHDVLHLYFAEFQTPHGALFKLDNDPDCFECRSVSLGESYKKYSFFKRRFQEKKYGRHMIKEIQKYAPDCIVSCNTPLDAQKVIYKYCRENKIKFVFWLQDLYGVAIEKVLEKRYFFIGGLIAKYYLSVEYYLLNNSDKVIAISEDFIPILQRGGVLESKIRVIYNWAPLDEVPVYSKKNPWSEEKNLTNSFCILYSGTLGLKHNPDLLLSLSLHFKNNPDIKIVVISEGIGADYLKKKKEEMLLDNLLIFDFQPFDIFPYVLASADILITILEPDASIFSVPSKVLTYHCAGRPLLLAVPKENLSARIVMQNGTGMVVLPTDIQGLMQAAETMVSDRELRAKYAYNARAYAEKTFNISKITAEFENILSSL